MKEILRTSLMVAVVATTAAAAGYYMSSRQGPPPAPLLTAQPAADAAARLLALKLPDADGREQPLAAWRGRVLVVNFWATWCPPCRREIPDFADLSGKYAGKGVQFVGISMEEAAKVRQFRQEVAVPYPLLVGSLELTPLVVDLGNQASALPFTVILRRDGSVHQARLGLFPKAELEQALQAALTPG